MSEELNDILEQIETLSRGTVDETNKIKEVSCSNAPNSLPNIWLDSFWLDHKKNLEKTTSSTIKKSNPICIRKRQRKKLHNEVIDEYAILNSMPEKLNAYHESQNKSYEKHVNFTPTSNMNKNEENVDSHYYCCCCCCYCNEFQAQNEIMRNLDNQEIKIQNDYVDINNNNCNINNENDLDKGLQFDLDNNDESLSLFGVDLTDKKSQINKADLLLVSIERLIVFKLNSFIRHIRFCKMKSKN